MWIAREGVVAPVPAPWKACTANGDDVFYFNFETGESIWDHPADERYRQLLEEKRKEKAATIPDSTKKEVDANCKTQPSPNSSNSASVEESFSASASLSVPESSSADRPSPQTTDGQGPSTSQNLISVPDPTSAGDAGVGLAGVGLGGARLGGPVSVAPKKSSGEKKAEASLEEIEEDDGLEVLEGSSQSAPVAKVEPKGASGVGGSSASELSEDFMSEGSPNSSFLIPPVARDARARSNSVGGDTLELSISASATGDLDPHAVPYLELEVASLTRCITMLRKIRERQQEYLELVLSGNPVDPS
eukprot:Skav217478  [mRNA]  locus=scaffold1405:211955:212866:- [translate_table: standard]